MPCGILLFDCYSVNIVVGAKRYDFQVGRDIVNDASSDTVYIKVVRIHKCHATEQEDSSADFAKRLVGRREVHSHD